jgi:hypothetical protein
MSNCENLGKYGLDIPSGVKLSEKQISYIGQSLKTIALKILN